MLRLLKVFSYFWIVFKNFNVSKGIFKASHYLYSLFRIYFCRAHFYCPLKHRLLFVNDEHSYLKCIYNRSWKALFPPYLFGGTSIKEEKKILPISVLFWQWRVLVCSVEDQKWRTGTDIARHVRIYFVLFFQKIDNKQCYRNKH